MERSGPFHLLMILLGCVSGANAFVTTTSCRGTYTTCRRDTLLWSASGEGKVTVAMTREDGKNGKLMEKIQSNPSLSDQLELLELPCIAHADGPDLDKLGEVLSSQEWDYVAITSPEAAKVLSSAWDVVDKENPIPVAAVGKATEQTLESFGIPVAFTPSKATAKTLAAELELKENGNGQPTKLLYPASARAQQTLQNGLSSRGFDVTRLNTYDTVTATWTDEQKQLGQESVQVVCFASPSSIKGWLQNTNGRTDVIAACIGETSAEACRNHNWPESRIFYPEKPGLDGWANAIADAAKDITVANA